MNNPYAIINSLFLSRADSQSKASIVSAIATHYGITADEAISEVTNEDSEHLLDYLTGAMRSATSLLMHRLAPHLNVEG